MQVSCQSKIMPSLEIFFIGMLFADAFPVPGKDDVRLPLAFNPVLGF